MKAGKGNTGYRKPMGSEVRRVKESWTETDPDPVEEARGHEKRMLDSFVAATASLEWLGTHEGWKLLGFDTCAEWWGARVQPVVEALGLAPTKELGQKVIGLIRAEEAALPRAQQRSARELAALVGVSEWAARTPTPRSSSSRNHERGDLEGTTETSGAVPPASTEDASPVLGEPDVDVQAASASGTQDSPAADSLPPKAHAGVPAVGGPIEERTEERQRPWDVVWTSVGNDAEIDRQTFDSHQLAVAEMERSRRAGSIAEVDVEPTPTDSPTGLEAAQPRDGRSETDSSAGPDQPVATTVLPGIDHHDGAGVSLSGEAPESGTPTAGGTGADHSVEPVGLEDGDAAVTPSSSDPDDEQDEPSATDLLLMTFGALIKLIDHMDAAAVGPVLFPAELEQLHQYVEEAEAFVRNLSRARFEALTRTP